MEVSAKADTNVQEAFRVASEEVIKKLENGQIDPLSDVKNKIIRFLMIERKI